MIFKKTKYTTPAGSVPRLYADMLKQPHILIAGATGSGKSIVINGLIYTALYNAPCNTQFILIDPKRVELVEYARLPHTLAYASEPQEMAAALNYAVELMDSRYKEMHKLHEKETHRGHIHIVIDEFADLMTTQKAETVKPICRLAQLGRAAHINLMIATQRPTRDIITGQIKVNLDSRLALRCPTAQDSRNIINIKGAETLPRYGSGYYLTPDTMQPVFVNVPMIPEAERQRIINHWTA